jgi:asparagine synthase (glutamine-hydrolysing)
MCGIFGVVETAGHCVDPEAARDALRLLRHRGPDDAGVLGWTGEGEFRLHGDAAALEPARCLLVHRRLSILDLSRAGWQPMVTGDGRHAIVFNGEIYNYRELRVELEGLGRRFRSECDTEVLLQGYAEWGPGVLDRLVGMFAFAVLDRVERRIFIARDCFGIKPLYYASVGGRFAFASEIKALLPLPWVGRGVHPPRLFRFLRDGSTDDGGDTLYADVRQLPAAHYLWVDIDGGAVSDPVRYWAIDLERRSDIPLEEAAEGLRGLFLDSVRLHLRSDVPVGAALSGGIDSSAIVSTVRKLYPQQEIHAFSFIAEDPAVCEEKWVDVVRDGTGATVHKVRLTPGELVKDLDRLIALQDEPFATTSMYAQYRVFQLAAAHGIKVMLDGQGADEMLAGYWPFILARIGSLVDAGELRSALALAMNGARLSHVPGRALLATSAGMLLPAKVRSMLRGAMRPNGSSPEWLESEWFRTRGVTGSEAPAIRSGDMLRRQLLGAVETGLPPLLRFEDRNSMAHSIESRVPFLNRALAEFIFSLPEEHLIGPDGGGKHVFRRAMRGIVPDAILDRRDKIGFATPELAWLTEIAPWVDRVLRSDAARAIPAFDAERARDHWEAVRRGNQPFSSSVWRSLNVIRWTEIQGMVYE